MNKSTLVAAFLVLGVALCNGVQAEVITVPNNSFELVYQPGTTDIVTLGGTWTNGLGMDSPLNPGQSITYPDGSTGSIVDIPGWVNDPDRPNAYNWPKGSASVTDQRGDAPDGNYYLTANGTEWGLADSGAIISAEPVTTISAGTSYTLSALVNGSVVPVLLELLADDEPIAASSTVDPGVYTWTEVSVTYDAADLVDHIGKEMKLHLGWGPATTAGNQSHMDMITLTSMTTFHPTDFDQDGDTDLVDINLLTAEADLPTGLAVPTANEKFDLSGDGMVGSADLDKWLVDAAVVNGLGSPYLKGDANVDGDVDIWSFDGTGDAQVLSSNLGTMTGMVWGDGDFNGDGDVDVWAFDGSGDAQHLSSNLGSTSDAAAGSAEAIYNAATGELTFDIGEGVAVVGIMAAGMKHGEVDESSPLGAPVQNGNNILAYFDAAGLPVGMSSVGAVLPTGLTDHQMLSFSYTPVGHDTQIVPVTIIVPEPSTITLLLVVGAVALCWRRRRA